MLVLCKTFITMAEKTEIKIFVASANDVAAERVQVILLLNQLNKSHRHLFLEAVEWEYDKEKGSQFEFEDVQDSINPLLRNCQIAVFIFYSRIGLNTRKEFELANDEKIKFMAYFRQGFSPNKDNLAEFGELLSFKTNLNNKVLYSDYSDEVDFYNKFYQDLNLYLSKKFPSLTENINYQNKEALEIEVKLKKERELDINILKEDFKYKHKSSD